MAQVRDGAREAGGMDTALSMARELYMAADAAVRQGYGSPVEKREVQALADIRDHIQNLEMTVRQAKTTRDESAKVALINDVDPLRRRVIAECHKHQAYVRSSKNAALVRRILEWCELKNGSTPQYGARSSADDVPRSTDGMVIAALTNPLSISDVSSGWVQNQARSSSHKTFDATSLSLTEWETKPKQPASSLLAAKAAAAATGAPAANSSLTINTAGSGSGGGKGPRSPSRRSPNRRAARAAQQLQQQLLTAGERSAVPDQYSKMAEQVLGAAAAQQQRPSVVAVAGAAVPSEGQQAIFEAVQRKLGLGRSLYGGAAAEPAAAAATVDGAGGSFDAEQQQQQNWRVTTEVAQQQHQAARQVRQPRAFLHLDGAGDASLTSSGGYGLSANSSNVSLVEQGDTVLIGGLRRYTADDDAFEPVVGASSGWEAVSHLRQQHPGMRASLRTSADVTQVLRNSNITEAAYLSSMASQVHILHDAVAQKAQGPDGLPAVPVVPHILAVRKKQRWWVSLLKLLAGTAGTAALVGAVAFAARQSLLEDSGSAASSKQQQGTRQLRQQKRATQQQAAQAQEQKQQQAAGMPRLPYVPVGPAPAASAGCG